MTAEAVKILKVVEKCLKGKGGEEGDVSFAFEEHLLGGVSLLVFPLRICTSPCLRLCIFVDWGPGQSM